MSVKKIKEKKTEPANNPEIKSLDQKNNYIIGIGASAGGLEALEKFFTAMPDQSGFSFVVVQHPRGVKLENDDLSCVVISDVIIKHSDKTKKINLNINPFMNHSRKMANNLIFCTVSSEY